MPTGQDTAGGSHRLGRRFLHREVMASRRATSVAATLTISSRMASGAGTATRRRRPAAARRARPERRARAAARPPSRPSRARRRRRTRRSRRSRCPGSDDEHLRRVPRQRRQHEQRRPLTAGHEHGADDGDAAAATDRPASRSRASGQDGGRAHPQQRDQQERRRGDGERGGLDVWPPAVAAAARTRPSATTVRGAAAVASERRSELGFMVSPRTVRGPRWAAAPNAAAPAHPRRPRPSA